MSFAEFQAALLLYGKANNVNVSVAKSSQDPTLLCVWVPMESLHHEPAIKTIAETYGHMTQAIDGMHDRLYFFDLNR